MRRPIKVTLTKDKEINQHILTELGMLDTLTNLREMFDAKLVTLEVEQGSDAAQTILDAHAEYTRKVSQSG